MAAFIIFHSTVKDVKRFQSYAMAVPATLKPYHGEVLIKGKSSKVFAGEHPFTNVGIISFPDLKHAHDWYASTSYQALVDNRDVAADMSIISYEEL